MSATEIKLTVVEARRRLTDTRGLSSEQIDDLQAIIARFQEARPRNQSCAACGCGQWQERIDTDASSVWCCTNCRRSSELTSTEWYAQLQAQQQAAAARQAAADAAAPPPRQHLREALGKLGDSRAALAKFEAALPAARAAVVSAQDRHDTAVAALADAETNAAEGVAAGLLSGRPSKPLFSVEAADAELADAIRDLTLARNAKSVLDGGLKEARDQVGYCSDKAKKAARSVIAAEKQEELISQGIEAKASYLEYLGQLGWLLRNHALPAGDQSAVRRLVADGNTPAAALPGAATAGIAPMEAAFDALMRDPEAVIG